MRLLLEYLDSAKRITIEGDVSLDVVNTAAKKEFSIIHDNFVIQIYDKDFETFCNINGADEITDLSRLKIVVNQTSNSTADVPDTSTSNDLRTSRWSCDNFQLPLSVFSLISQQEIKIASGSYSQSGCLHKASYKLKGEIQDVMSAELMRFGLYPTETMYAEITVKLINTFPFLRDPLGGGTGGWKIALKYRVQEVRRKLKSMEVSVNSGKRSKSHPDLPAPNKNIKKARRGEVNYAPEFPDGETMETLTEHKHLLTKELAKRDPNQKIIDNKMDVTFSLRRQEIIAKPMKLSEIRDAWPILFTERHLLQEMIRIVGFDIKPKMHLNLANPALRTAAMKKLKVETVTPDEVLQALPTLFKDKWSFFTKRVNLDLPDPAVPDLAANHVAAEDNATLLSQHVTIVSSSGEFWAVMGENVTLIDNLDFVSATICLLCIYYICDLCYNDKGLKSMLFIQEGLAQIPYSKKIPASVYKLLVDMKRSVPNGSQ